jgi:hypothetical protein
MSLRLLQAVLSSNHTKSSTRFAQVLLAWHACSRCGRVYISVARLARDMNIARDNAKALFRKLREAKLIERTGEFTAHGVPVYRFVGGDASIPGGGMKSCRFCREGGMPASPNTQGIDRQQRDHRVVAIARQEKAKTCGRDGCDRPQCPHWQFCREHADCRECAAAG